MAALLGGVWLCLLAGAWSLLCGYLLRRAWTSEADEEAALRIAGLRNDTARLRAEVEARNTQVKALEAELGGQHQRTQEVQGLLDGKDADMLTLGGKLASVETKAAGFDYARLSGLRIIDEREQAIVGLNARMNALQGELRDANARLESDRATAAAAASAAASELAALRKHWDAERTQMSAEHRNKLGLLEAAQADAGKATGSEVTALLSKVAGLAAFESQAKAKLAQADAELSRLRARAAALEAESVDWRRRGETAQQQLSTREAEAQDLLSRIEALRNASPRVVEKVATAPAPAAAAAKPRSAVEAGRRDDLKVVEGIGPQIEKLLNNAGYWTFRSLADADPAALALIMEAAGARFKLARTETWPEQAALLADNNMEAFKKLTDALKGGVRRSQVTPSK